MNSPRLFAPLTAAAVAAGLALAGSAVAAPAHDHARPKPHDVALPAGTPGQQTVPVLLPAAKYLVTPTSTPSLAQVLQAAPAGSVIHLSAGSYPEINDRLARTGKVVLSGVGDATKPMIDGAMLWGTANLEFIGVEFTSSVEINYAPVARYNRTAKNVSLINSEVNCGSDGSLLHGVRQGNTGILVRGATQGVTIEGDYVHNCTVGFASIAQDNVSSNVTIAHDTFTDFSGDAIDLGGLQNTVIDSNLITGGSHGGPESLYHNDGIQFFGNTTNTTITNNVLQNSGGQLLFIQDAVQSKSTGSSVNSNILVRNNLIYGSGAYAVQDQGALNVSFLNNTIWDSRWGGLLIRQSGYTGLVPANTTVAGNVLSGYGVTNVVPNNEHNNLIAGAISAKMKTLVSPSDFVGGTPTFANAALGNFTLEGVTAAPPAISSGHVPGKPNVPLPTTVAAGAAAAVPAPTYQPGTLGSTLDGTYGAALFGIGS